MTAELLPDDIRAALDKVLTGESTFDVLWSVANFGAFRADFTKRSSQKMTELFKQLDADQMRVVLAWVYDRKTLRQTATELLQVAIRRKLTQAFYRIVGQPA